MCGCFMIQLSPRSPDKVIEMLDKKTQDTLLFKDLVALTSYAIYIRIVLMLFIAIMHRYSKTCNQVNIPIHPIV
jgi:hypothetical protein